MVHQHKISWYTVFAYCGFVIIAIFAVVSTVDAQEDYSPLAETCNQIKAGEPVPEGYGAPYAFPAPNKLTVAIACHETHTIIETEPPGEVEYDIETDTFTWERPMWVYNTGYVFIDGVWQEYKMSPVGDLGLEAGNWITNRAEGTLPLSAEDLQKDHFAVAYTCLYENDRWKCGCRDEDCTENFWQVQRFNTREETGWGSVYSGN